MISYGILKPCYRCVYAKRHEPVLIFSLHRGPRIIVNLDSKTFVRKGECLGFENCGKCFDAVKNPNNLPCKWEEM
jgi:urease accessory protein UreE